MRGYSLGPNRLTDLIGTISIIIPAGGRSERMGAPNKLLLPLDGRTVLEHVVDAAVQAHPLEIVLVTGSEREDVVRAVGSRAVRCVHNPDFAEGIGSTLRTGVAAASPEASAYAILLADLPFVLPETIRMVGDAARRDGIIVPTYRGARGHPVVFGRDFRDDLLFLSGDVGARRIIEAHPEAAAFIETNDPGTVRDIDSEGDYQRARN